MGKLGEELTLGGRDKHELVEELQLAKRSVVKNVRNVSSASVAVTVRPADSMQREHVVATGTTRELRSRSVIAQVSRPVAVGGFYELTLEDSAMDVPATFGRCDQITMLAEDRFEARFQFLQPITLPGEQSGASD